MDGDLVARVSAHVHAWTHKVVCLDDVTEEAPVRGLDQAAPRLYIIRTERSIVVGEVVKCREVERISKAGGDGFDRLHSSSFG